MKIGTYLKVVLAGVAIASAVAAAPADRPPLLVIANQVGRSLSIVDISQGKQIADVPLGGITGHEVATSPDGKLAYVPIYGDSGVGKPGSNGSTMAVIDIAAKKVVQTVDFGHGVRPHMPFYDPVSGKLYVTNELDQAIAVIDPKSLKIEGEIPTGAPLSHMFVVSHDGKRAYTANVQPGSVSVLDMVNRKVLAIIPISDITQRIYITPDDRLVFTADQIHAREAVIDTATNTIKQWIPLPAVGYGGAVTPNGKYLLLCLPSKNQIAVIDIPTMKVIHTTNLPGALGAAIQPGGKVAYITCFPGHKLAQLDLSTWNVTKLIDVGENADGMAWARR
jgi:YVTN family beta-propeller protein